MRQPAEEALKAEPQQEDGADQVLYKTDEVEVVNSRADERVRIITPEKPSEEIRNKLKSSGFRWSPYNSAWQRKNTPEGIRVAERFAKENYPEIKFLKPHPYIHPQKKP